MPEFLMKLLRNCFPRLMVNNRQEGNRKLDEIYRDELHFVVPRKDFARFEEMKPEDGAFLTVSQYIFLYKYITSGRNNEPAPDYHLVYYFFRDKSSIFLLKGWVPTISGDEQGCIPERKILMNLNKKIQFLKANDTKSVYVKEKNTNTEFSEDSVGVSTQTGQPESAFELKSETKMILCLVHPGPPAFKSTYNWGVINTWSRHMAPESDDNAPMNIFNQPRQKFFQPDSKIDQMKVLDKEITDVIEGRPANTEHVSMRPSGYCGMVTSTLDTRDRSVRPRAAKGPRTKPHGTWSN